MEKLKQLVNLCEASVTLEFNDNRSCYETVEEHINKWGNGEDRQHIPDEVFAKMVELNTVVRIQFYPDTPNGFYSIWHYDIEQAIDQALQIIANDRAQQARFDMARKMNRQ